MSRPLRIELAGGLYHVTSRGDRQEAIYANDVDRVAWLEILAETCQRFNWRCHAWCQMTNHYHVVIETPEGNLARGMRHLNGVYTQVINRGYQRFGHVFQGRYKAIVVERDTYLLELARYVVLNPVRAGMVRDASEWAWSSYRAMIGAEPTLAWLETDWTLGQFSPQRGRARAAFIDFVRAGVGLPSLWGDLRQQIFLGGDAFIRRALQTLATDQSNLREVPRLQRRPPAAPIAFYMERYAERDEGMARAYATGDYTLQQIADAFGVHYSTVSRAVNAA